MLTIINLPSLKVIHLKQAKIQLYKVPKLYSEFAARALSSFFLHKSLSNLAVGSLFQALFLTNVSGFVLTILWYQKLMGLCLGVWFNCYLDQKWGPTILLLTFGGLYSCSSPSHLADFYDKAASFVDRELTQPQQQDNSNVKKMLLL